MKLVKIERNNRKGRNKFFYICTKCKKEKIEVQDKKEKTNFCNKCYLESSEGKESFKKIKAERQKYFSEEEKKAAKHPLRTKICTICSIQYNTTSDYSTSCTTCGNFKIPKRNGCTSKYTGVSYGKPRRGGKSGEWIGKYINNKKVSFRCSYKDSDLGTDEEKQDLCAIQREMSILRNARFNKRNFSDKELHDLKVKYVRMGLL